MAASRLCEQSPQLVGADGFEPWRLHYRAEIQALVAAMDDEMPERYAAHVAWLRTGNEARGAAPEQLRATFEALEFVLERHLPGPGDPLLRRCLDLARAELSASTAAARSEPDPSPLARGYLAAILDCDKVRALRAVDEALNAGTVQPTQVLDEVLPYTQREIGDLWHRGRLGIAEEHFATQVARQCVGRLLARSRPPRTDAPFVIVGSLQGDGHDIGVQLVACAFELAGWRVAFLGANTPSEDLAALARRLDAPVAALGGTLDEHRATIAAAVRLLRERSPRTRVIVGGAAFGGNDELWRRTGADAISRSASSAPQIAAGLLGNPR
jgi:methanogenic corrinoid protein MtbC1